VILALSLRLRDLGERYVELHGEQVDRPPR
jgi:hypothetical protein